MLDILQSEVLKQIKQLFELLKAKKFGTFDVNALIGMQIDRSSVEISYRIFMCESTTWIKVGFGYMVKKPKTDGKMAIGSQKGQCD